MQQNNEQDLLPNVNNETVSDEGKTLKASDVLPKNVNNNEITEKEAQEVINKMMENFMEKGGKPIIWKKPRYLLFLPAFLIVSLIIFIVKFQPSFFFSSILIIGTILFTYIRYEEYATQELAIYPFFLQYTFKNGLFKVETVDLVFGTSDFKYMKVEPYGIEHLYGFMKIFSLVKPQKWFASSNVYIYNADMRPIKIPYVYQCELFESYMIAKIDEFLMALNKDFKSKKGVIINGHLYEEIDGKLQRTDDLIN